MGPKAGRLDSCLGHTSRRTSRDYGESVPSPLSRNGFRTLPAAEFPPRGPIRGPRPRESGRPQASRVFTRRADGPGVWPEPAFPLGATEPVGPSAVGAGRLAGPGRAAASLGPSEPLAPNPAVAGAPSLANVWMALPVGLAGASSGSSALFAAGASSALPVVSAANVWMALPALLAVRALRVVSDVPAACALSELAALPASAGGVHPPVRPGAPGREALLRGCSPACEAVPCGVPEKMDSPGCCPGLPALFSERPGAAAKPWTPVARGRCRLRRL